MIPDAFRAWQCVRDTGLAVCQLADGTLTAELEPPMFLLPGSFNPFHDGHAELARAASNRFGHEVHFELSLQNVDKPELEADVVEARLKQFLGVAPIWLTRAAVFEQKSEYFPGAAFAIGFDTAIRLLDLRYYNGFDHRDRVLAKLLERGNRFMVGGRIDATGTFRTWDRELEKHPPEFGWLFEVLSESEFRRDVSSTELRSRLSTPPG